MFPRLNANRVPEVREVWEELARQQDEHNTFWEGAKAVQTGLARQVKSPYNVMSDNRCFGVVLQNLKGKRNREESKYSIR